MTLPAQRSRRLARRTSGALAAVLILIPVAILFGQSWQTISGQIDTVEHERQGVEYAITLGEVTRKLAEAQSSALRQKPALDGLLGAVAAADAVDRRLGADLRTSARWADVKAKIETLATNRTGDSAELYAVYAATADVLLALDDEARDNSELSRDPEGDTYHLQEAAGTLSALVVGTGRIADLTTLAVGASAAERNALLAQMQAVRTIVDAQLDDVTDNLQASLDDTTSDTLSTGLLTGLNRFRQGVDRLFVLAGVAESDVALAGQLVGVRGEAHAAQSALMATVHTELDTLLRERQDALQMRRWLAISALVLAVLLAVAPLVVPIVRRRYGPRVVNRGGVGSTDGESPAGTRDQAIDASDQGRHGDGRADGPFAVAGAGAMTRGNPRHADGVWSGRRRRSSAVQ